MSYSVVLAHALASAKKKSKAFVFEAFLNLLYSSKVDPYVEAVLEICDLAASRFL